MNLKITRDDTAETICDDSHPVRLGRNPQHYANEPWARNWAIQTGRKGYLCPGGESHSYSVWIVWDADDADEREIGTYDSYREAVNARDRELHDAQH